MEKSKWHLTHHDDKVKLTQGDNHNTFVACVCVGGDEISDFLLKSVLHMFCMCNTCIEYTHLSYDYC